MANRQKQQAARPVKEFRLGRIRAAIWENETQNGTLHNVTVSRLYKTDDDQWSDSTSFGRDDLLLVAKVMDRCHTWIFNEGSGSASNEAPTNGSAKRQSQEQEEPAF